MMNFWRVVRMSLRYRVRYVLAVLFAIAGAFFFGGNVAAALPLLKVLFKEQTLQAYVDEKIADYEKTIESIQARLDGINRQDSELPNTSTAGTDHPIGVARDKSLGLELRKASQRLWYYEIAKPWVNRFAPTDRYKTLVMILVVLVASMIVSFVCEFFNEVLVASVTEHTMLSLRNQFFRQLMRRELSGFTQQGTSELMARFTSDMKALSMGIEVILGKFIREPLKSVVCLGLACWMNWRLTLVTLVLVPVALLAMSLIGHMMKRAARRSLETMASIYQQLQESFQGIKIVKAFTME